jgi:hypothetical protein
MRIVADSELIRIHLRRLLAKSGVSQAYPMLVPCSTEVHEEWIPRASAVFTAVYTLTILPTSPLRELGTPPTEFSAMVDNHKR